MNLIIPKSIGFNTTILKYEKHRNYLIVNMYN